MIRVWLIALFVLLPGLVAAQADTTDFNVQIFGNTDNTPPSTPTSTSALPVSVNQIDISWGTSTDNFFVAGYVVFRDGVAIATTSATTFVDTGLAASTTYSYEIRAFDGLPNYSTSSAPFGTTTLPIVIAPVATSTSNDSGATRARVVVDEFGVTPAVVSATMNVSTQNRSRIEVRLGRTPSYELAYIVGSTYKQSHEIFINDLLPATDYYYEVVGYTPSGGQTVIRRGSFTTGSDAPPLPPTNVSVLEAVPEADDVRLTYQLPADFPQGGVVRIVRNDLGFAQSINDGVVVYEGIAQQFLDQGVLRNRDVLYYTVFVIDPNGLTSSGAVAQVVDLRDVLSPPGGTPDQPDGPVMVPPPVTATSSPLPPFDPPLIAEGFPSLTDFIVIQEAQISPFSSTTIVLSSEQPFVISVPVEAVQGQFKTMVVTLSDPRTSSKQFSFLLRLNGDQTAYTAVIAPLRLAGVSQVTVEVFDFDTKVISRYQTRFTFTAPSEMSTTTAVWYWRVQSWLLFALLLAPVLTLLVLWWIAWKRDRDDEDEDNNDALGLDR